MDFNWLTPLATLLAALGGYALAGWNESRRDQRLAGREADQRKAERELRRRDFQLQTLLELQVAAEALQGSSLDAYFVHLRRLAREGATSDRDDDLEKDDAWKHHREHLSSYVRLAHRVVDDETRESAWTFMAACQAFTDDALEMKRLDTPAQRVRAVKMLATAEEDLRAVLDSFGASIRSELAAGAQAQ